MDVQKAWFYSEYGSSDVLHYGDFPIPELDDDQVLVRVLAAALNPIDLKIRDGAFTHAAYDNLDFPAVPGFDMAGVIVDAGESVCNFSKGDEVFGNIQDFQNGRIKQCGTLTQYTAVEESMIALKPSNMSFEEAASFPLSLQIAKGSFDKAQLLRGQSVCVVAGHGDVHVPALAIQLAKQVYRASRIVAFTSPKNMNLTRKLGADVVYDCTDKSYIDVAEKFDVVLDTVGDSQNSCVLANERGKIIDIGDSCPHPKAISCAVSPSGNDLERLRGYIESERLKPVIDPTSPYAFSHVSEAFNYLESGMAQGKIVISCT